MPRASRRELSMMYGKRMHLAQRGKAGKKQGVSHLSYYPPVE
jgi:hypothetical protein